MDLFLNNNTITELTSDFFPDGNRELWKKTREVTMNFCGIKTIAEDTFEHLTVLQGKVNQQKIFSGRKGALIARDIYVKAGLQEFCLEFGSCSRRF